MDRATLDRKLAMVERHVAEGERILARQHQLIARIEGLGKDVTPSKQLLRTLEEAQRLHIADRERLREESEAGDARSSAAISDEAALPEMRGKAAKDYGGSPT